MIAVSFEDDRNAYNALTVLKELDSQQRVGVQEAVVVVRGEDGQLLQKDRVESTFLPGTAGGGLIGLLTGIIGGPFGMLIGGASGLLVGSLFDIADIDDTESALGAISSSVTVGRTALLAVVVEQSPEAIDAAMSGLGGTVLRRSVADVEAEIAAAEEAERKAKREARKELLRARHEHNKAATETKIEELKAKLHREQKTPRPAHRQPPTAVSSRLHHRRGGAGARLSSSGSWYCRVARRGRSSDWPPAIGERSLHGAPIALGDGPRVAQQHLHAR